MRLIIVCGNEECRREYNTDTDDRFWECPHCGRQKESEYYPFLTARMMQARIDGDTADWETVYDDAYNCSEVKVQEKGLRLKSLESDLDVPEEEMYPNQLANIEALRETGDADCKEWRERHGRLIKEARKIIVGLEDRMAELEEEKKSRRSQKKVEDRHGR